MTHRTILYGYGIKNGKVIIHEAEAKIVLGIFADYIDGKSLKTIADELTEQGVIYYLNKSIWTKNLVSRIIGNPKYIGADGYPSQISEKVFELANKKKSDMGGTRIELPQITTLIKSKLVCSCCGQNMGRRNKWKTREKWICPNGCKVDLYLDDSEIFSILRDILNKVRNNPDFLRLNTAPAEYSPSLEVIRQGKEIDRVKEQPGVEFGVLSKMVLKNVEHKYESCPLDRGQAMTDALMDKYRRLPPIYELDEVLIRETVEKISVNSNGTLTVTFINHAEVTNNEHGG